MLSIFGSTAGGGVEVAASAGGAVAGCAELVVADGLGLGEAFTLGEGATWDGFGLVAGWSPAVSFPLDGVAEVWAAGCEFVPGADAAPL